MSSSKDFYAKNMLTSKLTLLFCCGTGNTIDVKKTHMQRLCVVKVPYENMRPQIKINHRKLNPMVVKVITRNNNRIPRVPYSEA